MYNIVAWPSAEYHVTNRHIRIMSASGEAGADSFTSVRDVEGFKREILEQKTGTASSTPRPPEPQPAAVAAGPPTTVPASSSQITATLGELARLRDAGAITASEYEAKKAELLARL